MPELEAKCVIALDDLRGDGLTMKEAFRFYEFMNTEGFNEAPFTADDCVGLLEQIAEELKEEDEHTHVWVNKHHSGEIELRPCNVFYHPNGLVEISTPVTDEEIPAETQKEMTDAIHDMIVEAFKDIAKPIE